MASSKALDWLSVAEYAADGAWAAEEAGNFEGSATLEMQAKAAAKAAMILAEARTPCCPTSALHRPLPPRLGSIILQMIGS